jgi:hypothetical protein
MKCMEKPPEKWRTTRPMTFPTASTVPMSGVSSADMAAPDRYVHDETNHHPAVREDESRIRIHRGEALILPLVRRFVVFVPCYPLNALGKLGALFRRHANDHRKPALENAGDNSFHSTYLENTGDDPVSDFAVDGRREHNRLGRDIYRPTSEHAPLATLISSIGNGIPTGNADDDTRVSSAVSWWFSRGLLGGHSEPDFV